MPIKFLLLGGFWAFSEGGGWKCQFYFYGRGHFSEKTRGIVETRVDLQGVFVTIGDFSKYFI